MASRPSRPRPPRRKQEPSERAVVPHTTPKTIGIGIVAVIAVAAAISAFIHYPRTFNIVDPGIVPSSTTSNVVSSSMAVSSPGGDTYADPPNPLPAVNHAAYDAKMLALAHIPPAPIPKTTSTAASGTLGAATENAAASTAEVWPPYAIAPSRTALAALWPVPTSKAPYPTAGAILPFHRIVAYYGNFYSANMGVLGRYPESQVLQMLASTSAMWAAADPSTPVVPAIEYIATTAQASPGPMGTYVARMPASQIDKAIQMAAQLNGLVILDVQVGDSNVQTEVPLLAQYLKLPQVELALDPEFAMHNGQRPGTVIGTMDASSINWAANYLANLVTQYHLPPKILIVHRFTIPMVTNTAEIHPLPQVQIVMDMDGFGFPEKKINTYYTAIEPYPVQFTGFKLFYINDTKAGHLMTPQEVLRLSPQPIFIQYE